MKEALDFGHGAHAIRGNLSDPYQSPEVLARLRALAGEHDLPLHKAFLELAENTSDSAFDPRELVQRRGHLTDEVKRLHGLTQDLRTVDRDLAALTEAGAPEWHERLVAEPLDADRLLPTEWRDAGLGEDEDARR